MTENEGDKVLCYLNGLPLTKRDLEQHNDPEVAKERREQERVSCYRRPIKSPHVVKKEPCGEVTYLTDNQIRKEYGLMNKPFSSMPKNILWILYDNWARNGNRPLFCKDFYEKLERKHSADTVSASLSRVWQKLGEDAYFALVYRAIDPESKKYMYCLISNIDQVAWKEGMAGDEYLLFKYEATFEKRHKVQPKTDTEQPVQDIPDDKERAENININVNLTIRFIFGEKRPSINIE